MPAVSKAQYRIMQLAKHNPSARKRLGIPVSVADEFTQSYDKSMPQHTADSKNRAMARANALKAIKP